jgi:hypothetical protein
MRVAPSEELVEGHRVAVLVDARGRAAAAEAAAALAEVDAPELPPPGLGVVLGLLTTMPRERDDAEAARPVSNDPPTVADPSSRWPGAVSRKMLRSAVHTTVQDSSAIA